MIWCGFRAVQQLLDVPCSHMPWLQSLLKNVILVLNEVIIDIITNRPAQA
jgi:hypothetical protein